MYLILQREVDRFGFDVSLEPLMVVRHRDDVIRYFIERTLLLPGEGHPDGLVEAQRRSVCAIQADYDVPIDATLPSASYITLRTIDEAELVAAADQLGEDATAKVQSYLSRKSKANPGRSYGTILGLRFSHDAVSGAVEALDREYKILPFDVKRDIEPLLRRMMEKRLYNERRLVPDLNISVELLQSQPDLGD